MNENKKRSKAIPETKAISISIRRTFMDSPMNVVSCYDELKNRWQFGMFESTDKKELDSKVVNLFFLRLIALGFMWGSCVTSYIVETPRYEVSIVV